MRTFNPQMLKLAREIRGYNQKYIIEKIRALNQGNYSKIERGLLNPTETIIAKLSELLDFPQAFFYKENASFRLRDYYYRRRASIPAKELDAVEAKLQLLAMLFDDLLESVDIPEFSLPLIEPTDEISPEDIARRLRSILNIPAGPINNLVRIIEASGIIVYFVYNTIEQFSGISLLSEKNRPIIFVNGDSPNDRIRLTLAHELGHIIMHLRSAAIKPLETVELEAYLFGSEFLMPILECRNDLFDIQFRNLDLLKSYWGLSKAAIIRKAKNAKYLSESRYKQFMIELSRKGERKNESGYVNIDKPVLINKILDTYFNQLDYSMEDMLNILSIKYEDYKQFFEAKKEVIISISNFRNRP